MSVRAGTDPQLSGGRMETNAATRQGPFSLFLSFPSLRGAARRPNRGAVRPEPGLERNRRAAPGSPRSPCHRSLRTPTAASLRSSRKTGEQPPGVRHFSGPAGAGRPGLGFRSGGAEVTPRLLPRGRRRRHHLCPEPQTHPAERKVLRRPRPAPGGRLTGRPVWPHTFVSRTRGCGRDNRQCGRATEAAVARSDHKGACGDAAGPVVAGTRASQRPQPATVTGQAPYCFGPAPYPLLAQNVPRSALNTDLVACKISVLAFCLLDRIQESWLPGERGAAEKWAPTQRQFAGRVMATSLRSQMRNRA
ncbi:uncharacterized protein LOC130543102 [Ursus arctos]|uniref:uncharacterized protein LOC130543102 n=1 Tax=Ursus arctos TaxID=9644 RepID=UPI0025494D38|nr:uncharacterized protein LOC130543102 [Ursus arctos]